MLKQKVEIVRLDKMQVSLHAAIYKKHTLNISI